MKEDEGIKINLSCKYSLFLLEKYYNGWGSDLMQECFEYIDTYDTLEEAQSEQKELKQKTIILPSY